MDLTPMSVREEKLVCPFCQVTKKRTTSGASGKGIVLQSSNPEAKQTFVASSPAGNASLCVNQGGKRLGLCNGQITNEIDGGKYMAVRLAARRSPGDSTMMFRNIGVAIVPSGLEYAVEAEVEPIAALLEELAAETEAELAAEIVAGEHLQIDLAGFSTDTGVFMETTTSVIPEQSPALVVDEAANIAVTSDADAVVEVAVGTLKMDVEVVAGKKASPALPQSVASLAAARASSSSSASSSRAGLLLLVSVSACSSACSACSSAWAWAWGL